MTIGDLCEFKTKFEDADFWLQRKGSEKSVGTPSKEYNPENIGVKVINTDAIDPNYLYYYFQFLHQKGIFAPIGTGVLKLVNIKISDIKSIPISTK